MRIIDAYTLFGFWPKQRKDLSLDVLLRSMEQHGVERALSASTKGIFYDFKEGNRETLRACREHPEIVPVATIDPRRYYDCVEEIERCLDNGFQIFRFFPDHQDWPVDYLPFYKVVEELSRHRASFIFPVSVTYGAITRLLELVRDLETNVIFEGVNYWGFAEAILALKECEHLFVGLSNVDTPDGVEVFSREVGAERLIFGSNSPLFCFSSAFLTLSRAKIPDDAKSAVLAGNIEKVLKR